MPTHLGALALAGASLLASSSPAIAGERPIVDNPYQVIPTGPAVLDLSPEAVARRRAEAEAQAPAIPFARLDDFRIDQEPEPDPRPREGLPAGWVQIGDEVVPEAVAAGAEVRARPMPDALVADLDEGPTTALIDEICAFPDQVPGGVYTGKWLPGAEYPRRGTIYLNYTGGVLYNGHGENSAENYSTLARTNHPYPVFGGGEAKAIAVAQAVQADFGQWAIRVRYLDRPHKTFPWVMAMVGGSYSDTTAGKSGGVAPSADCEDFGMRNVCYSFTNTQGVNTQANIVGQEIGHTYGLGHTYGKDRIMAYGYNASGTADMIFGDDCATIFVAPDQGTACSGVNKCHCGDGDHQQDINTVSAIYAPPGPDLVEPTITILTPEDGAMYEAGANVDVSVDVWDDYGGYGWKLGVYQDGALLGESFDYDRARSFFLTKLPEGTYQLTAEIEDQEDHIVQHTITIHVGAAASTDGGGTETGSDTDATGGATESGGADDESAGSDGATTGGGADDDGSCNCRSAPVGGEAAALGLVVLAGLGARRRRTA
ncbi:MAG: Ig-like domain-containing protein [Nannocystaceae bacterium]